MLRRKLAESLTVRIFLLTFLLLLGAGGLTFALIAWATPITYTAVISDRLQAQVADLTQQLAQTNLADAGPILDAFVRESGAEVALTAPGGAEADTGSLLVLPEEDWQVAVTMSGADNSVQTYEADTYQVQIDRADGVVTATQTGILTTQITFADQEGTYQLLVSPQLRLANQAVEALGRVAPWLALALLAFSLLCAFGYSRYITRPIVRLNGIAGRMAELDLQWVCGERRRDEIGQLGRSLDKMARRLSAALTDLETANQALRGEVARERELDRQRMAFFSAASHELKTPVTILKGQLAGMLEGVGVYQDRDKYLLRSLQTTGRMERLIGEMLSISRMESGSAAVRQDPVDLSALMAQQLALDRELLEQRGQQLVSRIIIVKVRKRKDHGITPWKRCSHKKGGSVKGAGPLFLSLLSFPGTGMLDKPIPEAGEFGEKAGFQFLHGGLERFRRVVPRKLAPAREHVHPDVPVEDDPPPPRGGEDGGRGGRIGKVPGCRKMVFHRFQARVDGKTHTAHGPFLFKSGKW